jgi:putative PIN family toxin of toxin-antitoxin system
MDILITLYSSPALIDELAHTLNYPKFSKRITQAATTPAALALRYSALVSLVSPLQVQRVVPNDADDDQVLACAVAAQAEWIVSGDHDLLAVVTAGAALIELSR